MGQALVPAISARASIACTILFRAGAGKDAHASSAFQDLLMAGNIGNLSAGAFLSRSAAPRSGFFFLLRRAAVSARWRTPVRARGRRPSQSRGG